ncbi:MAG: hypothetical protein WAU39_00795 [Polyangiales bacterium]
MTWKALGQVLPSTLSDARLQLHWAAQLVSAPGHSLLPAKADYSHTSLEWDCPLGVLKGRAVGSEPLYAALAFEGLDLLIVGASRERSLSLSGHTMEEALAWLAQEICSDRTALSLPMHDMPRHPLAEGAAFSDAGDEEERAELAAWFANATTSIHELLAKEPNASPVRCWPHHFDVASLITLDPGKDAESARSIGVGLSPGDGSYEEPYFYVTPWPYPKAKDLPPLPAGAKWHTEGWTGAVLTADAVISMSDNEQEETVWKALHGAVATCRALIGS